MRSGAARPTLPPAGERENPSRAERVDGSALVFRVEGVAQPQGSMKGYVLSTGQVAITSDNPQLKRWRRAVATAARVELYDSRPAAARGLVLGAVRVDLLFVLPRPRHLPRRVVAHLTRPDLDKLTRAVLDALTKVVWGDDKQVVELVARKQHAGLSEFPYVDVRVETILQPSPFRGLSLFETVR